MKDWNESKIEAILDYINRRRLSVEKWYRKAIDEGDEHQADLYQEILMELDSMHEVTLRIMRM